MLDFTWALALPHLSGGFLKTSGSKEAAFAKGPKNFSAANQGGFFHFTRLATIGLEPRLYLYIFVKVWPVSVSKVLTIVGFFVFLRPLIIMTIIRIEPLMHQSVRSPKNPGLKRQFLDWASATACRPLGLRTNKVRLHFCTRWEGMGYRFTLESLITDISPNWSRSSSLQSLQL